MLLVSKRPTIVALVAGVILGGLMVAGAAALMSRCSGSGPTPPAGTMPVQRDPSAEGGGRAGAEEGTDPASQSGPMRRRGRTYSGSIVQISDVVERGVPETLSEGHEPDA